MQKPQKLSPKIHWGVIGLFIVLVYGFACLVLGFSAKTLEPQERAILVWFLAIFPVLILAAFYRLVTNHHKKLYAPSDFKDETHFFSSLAPMSEEQRATKLDEEVKRIEAQESTESSPPAVPSQANTAPTIRATYADAERLAFLAIEEEIGKPVRKYVEITAHGRKEHFDGVLVTDKEAHLIEIKFFSRPAFKREFLEAVVHRASSFVWDKMVVDKADREKVFLWLVVVVDFDNSLLPDFKRKVEEAVKCDLFDVHLRFFHIDDLKKKYG